MAVKSRKPRRISIPFDDYEALQKIASRKRTSVSKLLLQAAGPQITDERSSKAKMLSIVGLGDGIDEEGSVRHDEALYGR